MVRALIGNQNSHIFSFIKDLLDTLQLLQCSKGYQNLNQTTGFKSQILKQCPKTAFIKYIHRDKK